MTQDNTVNVKLSNSQLNILESGIKNGTEVTLNVSSNVVGDSNDENIFPHKLLLLTNTQVSTLCKSFKNNSSANIKLPKTQLHKIEKPGGILGRLFRTITKNWVTFNRKCTLTIS